MFFFQPGYTPLLIACQYQKTGIVRYLGTEEVAGVDFSACCADSEGADEEDGQKRMTGLHLAAIHDSPEIANLLIMKRCPVDTQDEMVCMCAILHEHREKGAVTTFWCLGNRDELFDVQ